MKTILRRTLAALFILHSAFFIPRSPLAAQSGQPATVTVTGRVFNTASGYYVRNAEVRVAGTDNVVYTEDGGAYSIAVPAGAVTLTASYTGVQPATVTLEAAPGGRNIADFELTPIVFGATASKDEVIVLDRFEVSAERVGQAKAIQEQRAAINAKTVIATDNFGELTQGNIGEFMKYMPGLALDYTEVEATGVRIGGLDPKYTGFSTDGINLASANASSGASNAAGTNATRALDIAAVSITGIESIEFNQTLTASMDAGSAAGSINLKSKYSFNIRKNALRYQIGLDGTSDALDFGRDYMPDDRLHRRIFPGGMLNYGGVFFDRRLGIEASVSNYTAYALQQYNQVVYSYYVGDPAASALRNSPIINTIAWRPGPKYYERTAANLSLDFKITPSLILSLRGNYNKSAGEFFNLYTYLAAQNYTSTSGDYLGGPSIGTQPESTLTNWVVRPTHVTSAETFLYTGYSRRYTESTNSLLSPRLVYKNGPFNIEFRGAYTKARNTLSWNDEGYFRNTGNRIPGIGWTATRPNEGSPSWTLTQTDGLDWRLPQNWNRGGTYDSALRATPEATDNIQYSGYVDVTYAMPVFGQPVTFKAGIGTRHNDFSYKGRYDRYNYLGPTGRQIQNVIPWTKNYVFDFDFGNIREQNWRADDHYEMARILDEHPEWFQYDEVRSYGFNLLKPRQATERVDAAYIEATSRYKRWMFDFGIRYEGTYTRAQVTKMRPEEDIAAARAVSTPELIATGMFDGSASIPGLDFKYYNGQRFLRKRDYHNMFLSGGLKYDITRNLRFQLSASQSILRPNYNDIAGVIQFYDETYSRDIWVPNPILKPEQATKYYAGLQYYLNPAGVLGISVYRLDIRNKQIGGMQITQEQAEKQLGFPLRDALDIENDLNPGIPGGGVNDEGAGDESGDDNQDTTVVYIPISYRSTANVDGMRTVYGITLEYSQQLTFLPGALKGLAVFGSYTWSDMQNAREDEESIGVIKRSGNGGIKYRYARFNVQLRASWQDDQLKRVTRPVPGRNWLLNDHIYLKSRIIFDLSGGFNLGRDLDLVFSIRNLFNAPQIYYSNTPGRMAEYYVSGAICSVSLKGSF